MANSQRKTIDPQLLNYCQSPNQRETLQAVIDHGGYRAAAKALGMQHSNVNAQVARVEKYAARQGYAPKYDLTHPVADGQILRGASTLYDADGNQKLQWVKSSASHERMLEIVKEYAEGLTESIPKAKPTKASRKNYDSALIPTLMIGDAHIGMRAYGKETKHHDFDTDIAVGQLRNACDYLVDKIDPAENGLLIDVGDYHHANGHNNQTFRGTPLDVDTRHRSTMYEGAMVMRHMIAKMLEKCRTVTVIISRGNHNDDVAPAMELMLRFYYENEPRVNVLPTEGYHHYLEIGANLLGVCHGDKQKPHALVASMARDMAQAWGRAKFRMWITGHFHKEHTQNLDGCRHKVVGALPPPDAWHASHGFTGDGEMELMVFRKSGGVHSSFVYTIPRPHVEPDVRIV